MTALITPDYIASIQAEAQRYGLGKLTGNEQRFLADVYERSQKDWFRGLTDKQSKWFRAIARKLEANRGKYGYQIAAERGRGRMSRYSDSYDIACIGR